MQLLKQITEKDSVSKQIRMDAMGYKGHLDCIEMLKAKAAIVSDRSCMDKA